MCKKFFAKIISLALTLILITANFAVVLADTPFQGYTYNHWGVLVPSPVAYAPVRSFSVNDLRCASDCGLRTGSYCALPTHITNGTFEPTDLHVDSQENVYIVDSGRNRIIVFDMDLNLNRVIGSYYQRVLVTEGFREGIWVEAGHDEDGEWREAGYRGVHLEAGWHDLRLQTGYYDGVWQDAGYTWVFLEAGEHENLRLRAGAYHGVWREAGEHRVWRDADDDEFLVADYYELELEEGYHDGVWLETGVHNLRLQSDGWYNGIWREEGYYTVRLVGGFNRPHGIFVTDEGYIYVADHQNHRVAILEIIDDDVHLINEITSAAFMGTEVQDAFLFLPMHVLVDHGGRVFVIVQHVFEGIAMFNSEGEFTGYYGTIRVGFNVVDLIWRQFFMTPEQRRRQMLWVPREIQSMDIDDYGFVYTTHIENSHESKQIMRLNPRGEDVLVNFNTNVVINGDQGFRIAGPFAGSSVFVDVTARSHGMYSALCDVRGRVYTYDSEGNLLYVFAGPGNLEGMVSSRGAVSIVTIGDDILILDGSGRGRILHYSPTEYGRLINEAIALRYDGHEDEAVHLWRKLVEIDENFALAWSGIGRSYLAMGDNVQAMYYTERGMDVRYYSIAFRRHRLDVMQETLPNVLTGGMVVVALLAGFQIVRKIRRGGGDEE
jgi:DNA-binding beta-propeller fold protein YncE